MCESTLMLLAASLPALTTLYWVCLIVGGGLLIVSSLAGGDADAGLDAGASFDVEAGVDADVDASFDADTDAGHVHAGSLASWLSLQFLVFFAAMFGLVGVAMTHLSGTTETATLICAVAGGLVVGQGVHQILRKLRRTSGDSTLSRQDYVNKLARVTVGVTSTQKGEVALRVGRGDRYIPALSKHTDQVFGSGDQVAVVGYRGGVAEVVSGEEFEFLTQKS